MKGRGGRKKEGLNRTEHTHLDERPIVRKCEPGCRRATAYTRAREASKRRCGVCTARRHSKAMSYWQKAGSNTPRDSSGPFALSRAAAIDRRPCSHRQKTTKRLR